MELTKMQTEDGIKRFEFKDGSKVWFTSDTHFSHANIIRFCKRPFANIQEMNEFIINEWNKVIGPDDTVFHLGDFAWGGSAVWTDVLSRLNGHKILIIGNHDIKNLRANYSKYFDAITFQMQILVEGQTIILNHYPFLAFGGAYRDQPVWQLFGHVHSQKHQYGFNHILDLEVKEILGKDTSRLRYLLPTQYDVGVDNNGYMPINFYQVKDIITNQVAYSKMNWFERLKTRLKNKLTR